MCFSLEVSIGTFIVSWGISFYLLSKKLTKKQKQNVIFLMIFSSIQFADAILWLIKMKKNTINFVITTFIIPFILSLQVFYNLYVINGIKSIVLIPVYLLILFSGITRIKLFPDVTGYSKPSLNIFSSPVWGSIDYNLIVMTIFLFLISYGRDLPTKIMMFISLLISFLLTGGYGSIWCAVGNLGAFYYLYKY